MNSRLRQYGERKPEKREYVRRDEPDRIKGTSKVRTWASSKPELFSKESSMDKLMQRAGLCRDYSAEQ